MPEPILLHVVFIGAECTGKTTLTKAVADHFAAPWSQEFVRTHVERIQRPLNSNDLVPIARGQIAFEDAATAQADRWVFHDTNLLASIFYADYYFQTHLDWVDSIFLSRPYHHYFLCTPDIPWEADPGQREGPHVRDMLHHRFKATLEQYQLPFTAVGGTLNERTNQVCHDLRHLFPHYF
jgi:nicotinamide riboside kinase